MQNNLSEQDIQHLPSQIKELKQLKQKHLIAALKALKSCKYDNFRSLLNYAPLLDFDISRTTARANEKGFTPIKPNPITDVKAKIKLFKNIHKKHTIMNMLLVLFAVFMSGFAIGMSALIVTGISTLLYPALFAGAIGILSAITSLILMLTIDEEKLSQVIKTKEEEIAYEIYANPDLYGDMEIYAYVEAGNDFYERKQTSLKNVICGQDFRNANTKSIYSSFKALYMTHILLGVETLKPSEKKITHVGRQEVRGAFSASLLTNPGC